MCYFLDREIHCAEVLDSYMFEFEFEYHCHKSENNQPSHSKLTTHHQLRYNTQCLNGEHFVLLQRWSIWATWSSSLPQLAKYCPQHHAHKTGKPMWLWPSYLTGKVVKVHMFMHPRIAAVLSCTQKRKKTCDLDLWPMTNFAPVNFKGAGPRKICTQIFIPASRHTTTHYEDKFGEVIPTGPKVLHPHTLNCAPIFEFLLSQKFCHPNFWT